MNIALFSDSYLPTKSGIVTVVVQLREQLIKQGHKVVLVTVETTEEYEQYDPYLYRVKSIPLGLGTDQFMGIPMMHPLVNYLKENQIELIHCHTEFGIGISGLRAAKIMHIPAICTTHTMWTDFYKYYLPFGKFISPSVINMIMKKYYSKFSALIGVSTKARNYFKQDFMLPKQPSIVIPNSIDKSKFQKTPITKEERKELRSKYGITDDETMLLFVGRVGEEKRVKELLSVCKKVTDSDKKIKAVFVGNGPALEELIESSRDYIKNGSIHFPGFIEWTEVHKYYESADIFVTCSLSEMHSMTILEALLSGLPVVARKDESYFDSIYNDQNGYLCDTDEEMVERLIDLAADQNKIQSMGAASLEITEKFSIETYTLNTIKVYQEVMKAYPAKIDEDKVTKLLKDI